MNELKLSVDAPAGPDQEQILAKLEQRITELTSGRIRDLRIEPVGEGLLLSGRTNTYYSKQLATQIAMESYQPHLLENSIEVI